MNDTGETSHATRTLPNVAPMAESERLTREKEILGFYISGHPLEPYRMECELFATHTVSNLGKWVPEPLSLGDSRAARMAVVNACPMAICVSSTSP